MLLVKDNIPQLQLDNQSNIRVIKLQRIDVGTLDRFKTVAKRKTRKHGSQYHFNVIPAITLVPLYYRTNLFEIKINDKMKNLR